MATETSTPQARDGVPDRADARGALVCAVLVPLGTAAFVLLTVADGNLSFLGVAALATAALAWRASRRFVDAVTVLDGERGRRRHGPLATASPRYLRLYAHALGWPARWPGVAVWVLWLVSVGAVVYFLISFAVRVISAAVA
ncbi:hypothetical protein [Nigerium massiliense]|uniref:hypothetical protein n=1 Tax=Nigerium massiliense TaxID=1522317 RepID=UPI00058C6FC1|nr:hypothetical protein [Nigerium massiliense]